MIPAIGKAPRVSIGVPVRNGGSLLAGALRSLTEQTESDIEIIISDNGSTDGSEELLQAFAAADPRVRYVRQETPIRAYDNFRFVLRMARGEYFMWAAHDDTRDPDFVARLVEALDAEPLAVLAFGDVNVVTPGDPAGHAVPFAFDTVGLGIATRLARLSRRQCYYIYGVWRTAALRRVPYAYCDWWSDLPMMLAAAVLGTFLHVPGTRLHYFEVPKSGLEYARTLNFTDRFNLASGVASLVVATYRACAGVGGTVVGCYAASLVVLKQVANFPGFVWRRLTRTVVG